MGLALSKAPNVAFVAAAKPFVNLPASAIGVLWSKFKSAWKPQCGVFPGFSLTKNSFCELVRVLETQGLACTNEQYLALFDVFDSDNVRATPRPGPQV